MPPPSRPQRRPTLLVVGCGDIGLRVLRLLRGRWRLLAWSVAGVYALYLLAGNIFLNTPLFDLTTNRKPQKFVMRTGPAITLLPGHVIAWNVHMRGHVNHTVYVLHADRASA